MSSLIRDIARYSIHDLRHLVASRNGLLVSDKLRVAVVDRLAEIGTEDAIELILLAAKKPRSNQRRIRPANIDETKDVDIIINAWNGNLSESVFIELMRICLLETRGNQKAAAMLMGISERNMRYWIKKLRKS